MVLPGREAPEAPLEKSRRADDTIMASALIQPNGQLAVPPPHEVNPPWVLANALFHTIPLLVFPIMFVRSVFNKRFRHTSL